MTKDGEILKKYKGFVIRKFGNSLLAIPYKTICFFSPIENNEVEIALENCVLGIKEMRKNGKV